MTNFPTSLDDDSTIPAVNNNITEIGGDAINALRDAVFALESNIGLTAAGSMSSLSARLGIAIAPDGQINASALTSLGLVTLPITDGQISSTAQISESKLKLDHRTQDLFNYIRNFSKDINIAIGWISATGIKLEPHLLGAIYRHNLSQIDVSNDLISFPELKNKFNILRNNTDSYQVINDINNELLAHQFADGTTVAATLITTNNGSTYPATHAHTSSGIFLDTARFSTVPATANDLQQFADFIDNASIFLLGTRIQNLYSNGISRISRSSSLSIDGYGQQIIPVTTAIAYLKNLGGASSPFDSIDTGDDIIEFIPSTFDSTNNVFDAKFAQVKVGDIVRINYGIAGVGFVELVIKEKKYVPTIGSKKYIVRVAGKNLTYTAAAQARIDRPLFNNNKYGVLSISPVNNSFASMPSLIINSPRSAQALGLGFNASELDSNHYLLYLGLYLTGFPQDGYTILPPIDVTGNRGTTPGLYTLESIVQTTNNAFRQAGFNYRFSAFSYQGEFGICLADSYNNAGFSIFSSAVTPAGLVDVSATQLAFPKNVVDLSPTVGSVAPDPLGFGPFAANIASPPYMTVYGSAEASQNPTKVFIPFKRNNYYVNGVEIEKLNLDVKQLLDGYGDTYWNATIQNKQTPSGRVKTTYRILNDLSTSKLKIGKTIVIQPKTTGSLVNFGRFIIEDIAFFNDPDEHIEYTDITVYDSVHGIGSSPANTLDVGNEVLIYFNSDSVSFNIESATDYNANTSFKRHFEIYSDQNASTFTHERGRINISGGNLTINSVPLYGTSQLSNLDIVKISPKLRGYQFGNVTKIALNVLNYNNVTGIYDGYLGSYDGVSLSRKGALVSGKVGEITRFYDETNIDYIDLIFDINAVIPNFTNQIIDFQLFPTLSLDSEITLLGTCQVNDTTKIVDKILDERQFGNISEKELSSSALNFISAPERLLHSNGVIKGFDIISTQSNSIVINGGTILVNGKIIQINNETVYIPIIKEFYNSIYYNINWALCINDKGEYESIPLLDSSSISPTNSARIFVATDLSSFTNYNLPAVIFSDLVNNRKDLSVLHIITASITDVDPSTISLSNQDARRFVYKKDWSEYPTLTNGMENGEFRTVSALTTWFNFNSSLNRTANIRGTFNSITSPFSFTNQVRLLGDGDALFNILSALTVSNVEFNNMSIIISNTATVSNSTFNNVTVTITGTNIASFTNCIFNNCTITCSGAGTFTMTADAVNGNTCKLNNSTISAYTGVYNLSGEITGNKFYYSSASVGISLSSTVRVSDNKFIALNSTLTSQFISIADGTNGVITQNAFYRNSNTLVAYILAPNSYTSGTVSITDNFFDSTTIDGTDQNLVKNLPLAWSYVNNINTPPTVHVKTISGASYTVTPNDYILAVDLSIPMTINLPQISKCPVGRILIIKEVSGQASSGNPITLHRASITEYIEDLPSDYVFATDYGSITLVARAEGVWILI